MSLQILPLFRRRHYAMPHAAIIYAADIAFRYVADAYCHWWYWYFHNIYYCHYQTLTAAATFIATPAISLLRHAMSRYALYIIDAAAAAIAAATLRWWVIFAAAAITPHIDLRWLSCWYAVITPLWCLRFTPLLCHWLLLRWCRLLISLRWFSCFYYWCFDIFAIFHIATLFASCRHTLRLSSRAALYDFGWYYLLLSILFSDFSWCFQSMLIHYFHWLLFIIIVGRCYLRYAFISFRLRHADILSPLLSHCRLILHY